MTIPVHVSGCSMLVVTVELRRDQQQVDRIDTEVIIDVRLIGRDGGGAARAHQRGYDDGRAHACRRSGQAGDTNHEVTG